MRSGPLSLLALVSLAAAPSWAARKAAPRVVPKIVQSCDAHKFETVVDAMVDGQPHQSKVRLCGVEGQTDAQWIETLRDAIRKLDANKDMPAVQRQQIVAAIRTEISRLTILGAGPVMPRRRSTQNAAPAEPLSRDYAMLPPLPPPLPQDDGIAKDRADVGSAAPKSPAAESPNSAVQKDFAQLPPMPPVLPASPPARGSVLGPAIAPRLNFACDTPGELSTDAPCAEFDRETTLTVHAKDDVPAGTVLQFVRNDRPQADIPLDGLRRGGMLRLALPAKVCSGFSMGKLELRIVREDSSGTSQPLASEGPYSLRC